MANRNFYIGCVVLLFLLQSCGSAKYIQDEESRRRQEEVRKHRTGNVFAKIGLTLTSIIVSSTVDMGVALFPHEHEFKKLKILNSSDDTLFVNMLTDVYWDEYDYCDFMDIRIPPEEKTRILVPVDAVYHLYFSNTPQSDDDELIEINTSNFNKISLYPGLTKPDELHNPSQQNEPEKFTKN